MITDKALKYFDKDFLKEFVFEQKCIPVSVRRRWCRLNASVREELQPRAVIDLERTYINPFFCWLPHASRYSRCHLMEHVRLSDDLCHRSMLLQHSPHVQFLLKYREKSRVEFAEFMNDDYFMMMLGTMQLQGSFFNITCVPDTLRQAEYFLGLYHAHEKDRFAEQRKQHLCDGGGHTMEKYARVLKVPGTDAYVISDGHHRLSTQYVLGKRLVPAIVVDRNEFWLPEDGMPKTGAETSSQPRMAEAISAAKAAEAGTKAEPPQK